MSLITWSVCLDTDRDYTFDNGIDNITQYVMQANWNNGFASPTADVSAYDDFAPPARLTLTLKNDSNVFNPETLGTELVSNGNFSSWTSDNPNSWTVTGESGTNPQVSQTAPDKYHGQGGTGACNLYTTFTTLSIAQTILTVGTSYKVAFKVTAGRNLPGGIRLYSGTQQIGYLIQKTGNYTFYFNASSTSFKIETWRFTDLTIDDVSIKATSLYGHLIYPGALVRVQATYSGVTYPMFYGGVSKQNGITFASLQSGAGGTLGSGSSQVTITVEDGMLALLDSEYAPPLLTNVTIDQAIQRMFDDGVARYPYGDYGTLLDVQGTNVLGLTARLYGYQTSILDLETGITTLEYLGDMADKGHGVSAQGYLRDSIPVEGGGRLFWNGRTGEWTFHNRYHDPLNNTVTATYTQDAFTDLRYSYADMLVNRVSISYTTRLVGASHSIIWSYKGVPFELKRGDSKSITARYVDPNNDKIRIGIQTGDPIIRGVDIVANASSDGGGENRTNDVSIGVTFDATSAKVSVRNDTHGSIYITHLQLRATPFTWQTDTYTATDGESIAYYGVQSSNPKSIRTVVSDEFVQLLAKNWLRKFKAPIAAIQSVSFNALDSPLMAVNHAIGDKITITDTFTTHDADYIIVGEQHQISNAGNTHQVTWILKAAIRESIYIVGVTGKNELDSENVLGL